MAQVVGGLFWGGWESLGGVLLLGVEDGLGWVVVRCCLCLGRPSQLTQFAVCGIWLWRGVDRDVVWFGFVEARHGIGIGKAFIGS